MTPIDHKAQRILQLLETDGRISNLALADAVGLSPSACLRRVQELERSGIIRGYRASINRALLGKTLTAYLAVGLNNHTKAAQQAFEEAIDRAEEVRECHNVTGDVEYLLRVEVADMSAYKTFHTDVLGTLPQVRSITTYMVLESPKDQRD